MNKSRELVHGLYETVELKDWDFAIILSALKVYADQKAKEGKSVQRTYALNLAKKLRIPFSKLVKRTKRKHREILASLESQRLEDLL